jgi:ribose transport system permease protein
MSSTTHTRRAATPDAGTARRGTAGAVRWLQEGAERYALVGLTVGVCLVFSFLPQTRQTFWTATNIRQVLTNQAPLTILAMGALIPLVSGSFDLSIGAVSGVSAVATATSMGRFGLPLWAAIVIAVGVATAIGVSNGFLIAYVKLNAFIVTLGMNILLTGVISWYTNEQNISTGISQTLVNFGSDEWLGIPAVLYLVAVIILLTWYLLGHHVFGRRIQAIGSSTRAAELVGINVRRHVLACFVLSGLLAGITGVTMVATSAAAVISQGPDLLFPMLTVVFLSATTITPGRYNAPGAVVGVIFVAASVSGLILVGAADWVQDVFNGAALIVAVAISTTLARSRRDAPATLRLRRGQVSEADTPHSSSDSDLNHQA